MTATPRTRHWSRRSLLRTGAAAAGGAVGGAGAWHLAGPRRPSEAAQPEGTAALHGAHREPFAGRHQAGVVTSPQAQLSLSGLDLRPEVGATEVGLLLSLISDDAARLTSGRPSLADTEPELATVLARLTLTLGLGPRALRLLGREGAWTGLPDFAGDRLEERWGQTDLAVQLCADDPVTLAHARRMLHRSIDRYAEVRWVQEGFRRAVGSEPSGTTMRNLMGQVDGTTNLREVDPGFDGLVWEGPLGPGSTTMVLRRIRADMEGWDQVGRAGKELAMGRRLSDGAPLTGTREHDEPDFEATDGLGLPVIDAASHVRRARSEDPAERFLRRAYNYAATDATAGREDSGLVFIAFASDVERQFVPVQQRLADLDRLNAWVTAIGSAVYVVPRGARAGGVLGEDLLTT